MVPFETEDVEVAEVSVELRAEPFVTCFEVAAAVAALMCDKVITLPFPLPPLVAKIGVKVVV